MIYGQCYTPRMTSYESKTQQRSAPKEQGLWQRDADWDCPPRRLPVLPSVVPGMPPTVPNSPADIHSSSQVFTTARLFLLICFSSQTDWRAGPGGPALGRGGRWRRKHSHTQPESPVWQIVPVLDFFLHWPDVVFNLFFFVIIPH